MCSSKMGGMSRLSFQTARDASAIVRVPGAMLREVSRGRLNVTKRRGLRHMAMEIVEMMLESIRQIRADDPTAQVG